MNAFFSTTPMRLLLGLVVFAAFLALISYASLNLERIAYVDPVQPTISATGEGEVLAVPDIGQFTFSVQAEAKTAEAAQAQSGKAINDIVAYLTESGVAETDIKTRNYNLWPRYQWVNNRICAPDAAFCPEGERVQTGFEVSQSVQVKVRDTDKASAIITGVGERGATNISGLEFVVDDVEALQAEARVAAIADAQTKIRTLAEELGVTLGDFAGYYEEDSRYQPEYAVRSMAFDGAQEESFAGPALPTGEEKTTVRVMVTYEVK